MLIPASLIPTITTQVRELALSRPDTINTSGKLLEGEGDLLGQVLLKHFTREQLAPFDEEDGFSIGDSEMTESSDEHEQLLSWLVYVQIMQDMGKPWKVCIREADEIYG